MVVVQFPEPNFRITTSNGTDLIFDPVRKSWVKLSPEEWVRQNLLAYLTQVLQIPLSLIAVEKQLKVGELVRRFDIVVFKNALPWLVIECKAPDVPLGDSTVSQVLSYVSALACPFFFISNGHHSFGWQVDALQVTPLNQFPSYV